MLFHEYLRLIRDVKPKYVVMENVTGILDMYMLDFLVFLVVTSIKDRIW